MNNDKLLGEFINTEPATYGHFPGVSGMSADVKPVSEDMKLAGYAFTVSIPGKDSCYLYKALKEAPPGAILVIDREGDKTFAAVGEMVVRNAMARKLGGIVINGPITDSIALKELGFPVFSMGISVLTTNVWCVSGDYKKNVECGGVVVKQGDLILGNADGVVVISKEEDLEAYLERAKVIEEREVVMRKNFADNKDQLLDVDPLLEARVLDYIGEKRELGRK